MEPDVGVLRQQGCQEVVVVDVPSVVFLPSRPDLHRPGVGDYTVSFMDSEPASGSHHKLATLLPRQLGQRQGLVGNL